MVGTVLLTFAICLFLGFPIGIAIGLSTILPGVLNPNFTANAIYIIRAMVGGVDSTSILAIPLFMLSGAIMAKGGISKKLFDVFAFIVGKRTAGIPIAVVITCVFYGAISGSGPATTAAVGAMTIPILVSLGYDKVFSAAIVASAGGIGIIIPPSIPFIMYGMMTGTSVGALFLAGFIPGILVAVLLIAYIYVYCKYKGEDKEKIAENYERLREKGIWKIIKDSFFAILTPVIILGGIYSGIVTPTEAAVISVFYSLIICFFIYKTVSKKSFFVFLDEAVRSYAPLGLLLAFAIAFSRVLTILRAPQALSEFFISTFSSGTTFLIAMNAVLLIVGMFMDAGPAVAIMSPMLLPIITKFNINPVHFGVVMVINLAIGFISPPFGLNLFVASPFAETTVGELGKKAIAFVLVYLIALMLITFIPQISLLLV
jgi:C4-dicarboxylate transporter DctM subunit